MVSYLAGQPGFPTTIPKTLRGLARRDVSQIEQNDGRYFRVVTVKFLQEQLSCGTLIGRDPSVVCKRRSRSHIGEI